jgi:predicted nucleotidyltransferase
MKTGMANKDTPNQDTDGQRLNFGPDSPPALQAMGKVKAFLDPYRRWIHSLVLFGSYALGRAERGSDIDLLVILRNGRMTREIKNRLFHVAFDLSGPRENTDGIEIQVVPFDEKEIDHLFRLSTPLAHAIREGLIIWDNGFFHSLLAKRYSKWPTREAAEEALIRWIIGHYYLCAVDLKHEIQRDHGPGGMCSERERCVGHFKGDILARVISRMLYVTLPEKGMLPLTKRELRAMSAKTYGKDSEKAVMLALQVLREGRPIDDKEFRVMFPFARRLFRECMRICGRTNPRVIQALRTNAEISRIRVKVIRGGLREG